MSSSNKVMGKKKASLRDKQVCLLSAGNADIRSLSVLLSTNERNRRDNHLLVFQFTITVFGLMYNSLGSISSIHVFCCPDARISFCLKSFLIK